MRYAAALLVALLAVCAVYAGSTVVIMRPPAVAGGGITDDFNRASIGANWTSHYGTFSINSSTLGTFSANDASSVDFARYSATALTSASQYASVVLSAMSPDDIYLGVALRATASPGTDPRYAVVIRDDISRVKAQVFVGTTENEIGRCTLNYAAGDTMGVEVTGSGTATIIKVWRNPGARPWSSPACTFGNGSSLITCSYASPATACDSGYGSAPAAYPDSGTYAGVSANNMFNTDNRVDDFAAGDI